MSGGDEEGDIPYPYRHLIAKLSRKLDSPKVQDHKSKKKKAPKGRHEWRNDMKKRLEQLEQQQRRSQSSSGQEESRSGNAPSGSGGSGNSGSGHAAAGNNGADDNSSETKKEEPFGYNKNIHTLGCYLNSKRSVVKKGSFHCFES